MRASTAEHPQRHLAAGHGCIGQEKHEEGYPSGMNQMEMKGQLMPPSLTEKQDNMQTSQCYDLGLYEVQKHRIPYELWLVYKNCR